MALLILVPPSLHADLFCSAGNPTFRKPGDNTIRLIMKLTELVESLAKSNRISNEEAWKLYLKNAYAQLELKNAIAAVKKYQYLYADAGRGLFCLFLTSSPNGEILVRSV